MRQSKLLVVEDDEGLSRQYSWSLTGFVVLLANCRLQALQLAQREKPAIGLVDLGLPPDPDGVSEGLATLEELRRLAPAMKVIVVTGSGERAHALRAIAAGAYDFHEKPVDIDVLRTTLDRAERLHWLEEENRQLSQRSVPVAIKRIVTANEAMRKVCQDTERLAGTQIPVLLLGESGTGKEALASALHDLGPRAKGPFVAINCGAIPETLLESELFGHERGAFTGAIRQSIGRIESAHRGTLFLDEIGDLPFSLQVKLLRFLQDQVIERIGGRQSIKVDVRVVSATNQSIDTLVAEGRFRSDLLYRLNGVTLRIPPLRARNGDPELLAHYFLNAFRQEFGRDMRGFTSAALAAIGAHSWPGNVRELENRVRRAVVMSNGTVVDSSDLELDAPTQAEEDLDLRTARLRAERDVVGKAVARSNGILSDAARMLGVSRPTLYGLLATHGLTDVLRKTASLSATE